jgi:hypothetical protein
MQALRYVFYAHRSILVVPQSLIDSVRKSIDIFEQLRIGLWGSAADCINEVYTPEIRDPLNPKRYDKAIRQLMRDGNETT